MFISRLNVCISFYSEQNSNQEKQGVKIENLSLFAKKKEDLNYR